MPNKAIKWDALHSAVLVWSSSGLVSSVGRTLWLALGLQIELGFNCEIIVSDYRVISIF